jgi:type IV secretory pathway TraG/TraD family ATPase VirD4
VSVSSGAGHGSVTTSAQWQPVIQPDQVRRLPRGTALMVYRNTPAVRVALRPWWRRPDAKKITEGRRQVEQRTGRRIES